MTKPINRRDLDFLLYEILNTNELLQRDRYKDHDRETITAVLDLAEQVGEKYFAPLAAVMDNEEPEFINGKVKLPDGVKEAHTAFIEAGFMNPGADYDADGMQLPSVVTHSIHSIFNSFNVPLLAYLFLTNGVSNMLDAWGSDELKQKYLPGLNNGRYYGTMCLSEPHAGSNLADIRTKAEPQPDGTYHIKGTKMWISGGDQEISENIIHMVLAKIPGGPAGVKGISLFLVPKRKVDDNGEITGSNGVALAGLNHKMGYRGTTNTLLNFGEDEPSVGYLVGPAHQGLKCMFHMMNEARIGVGSGAVVLGYAGYRYSLDYAKQRPQGRHITNKNPEAPQVNIIEHTDVKRMLLQQKAYVEGGYALALYCAKLLDDQATGNADHKETTDLLLDILTPIIKAWPSDYCLKANELAIQVLGGYGYTREYPVERLYRDNRLNPIHEGTNGIQGLDLLGRKAVMNNGAALRTLISEYEATIKEAHDVTELNEFSNALGTAKDALVSTTMKLGGAMLKDVGLGTANSTEYLHAFGHIVVAWLWLKQAIAAQKALPEAIGDDIAFYQGKLAACRYFFRYELPIVHTRFALLEQMDDTCLKIENDQF